MASVCVCVCVDGVMFIHSQQGNISNKASASIAYIALQYLSIKENLFSRCERMHAEGEHPSSRLFLISIRKTRKCSR